MSNEAVKIEAIDGETWIVTVNGSISFSTNLVFKDALDEVLSNSPGRLLIDLTSVTFCNSQGFGDLLRAYTRMVKVEGRFGLVAPTPEIRKVLETTKFSSIIDIHASREAALAG